jgi:hypothetical protein
MKEYSVVSRMYCPSTCVMPEKLVPPLMGMPLISIWKPEF